MRTILRIFMILLVGAIVAGAFFLAVNNGSITSSSNGGQPLAIRSNSQFANQPRFRPEGGDRDGGSIRRGFDGVFGTLAELTAITIAVLLIQKASNQLERRKLISIQR